MNYPLLFSLFFVLAVSSCTDDRPAAMEQTPSNTFDQTPDLPVCTDPAYRLYPETVDLWEKSWAQVYHGNGADDKPAVFYFAKEHLDTLFAFYPDADGLRMYYCLLGEEDTIPSLALVNTQHCNDKVALAETSVLVSAIDTQFFATQLELVDWTERWQSYQFNQPRIHTPIHAYNYRRAEILSIVDSSNSVGYELAVRYGLRTISPNDDEFLTTGMDYGSVVMCNILSSGLEQIRSAASYNFAWPCPQLCDSMSAFIHSVEQ